MDENMFFCAAKGSTRPAFWDKRAPIYDLKASFLYTRNKIINSCDGISS